MASALAIPSLFVPPITAPSQSVIPSFVPLTFIGFIPDSPERPPRTKARLAAEFGHADDDDGIQGPIARHVKEREGRRHGEISRRES